jgi:hypothetical protein
MFAKIGFRWLLISTLALTCLLALGTLLAQALNGGLQRAATWSLSTELLALGLVSGLVLTFYLFRKTHHTRRHTL